MEVQSQTRDTGSENPVIQEMLNLGHEQVVFCNDAASCLKAIIGIHNTILGPALGGTRMWVYNNELEALNDVLRLSRGMTYKAAVSGLNLGGGKAVIMGDSRSLKNEALMRRFGRFVDSLGGKYITAEDVGMSTKDMEYIHMETQHVTGIPESLGGGGDPSPVTAYGVYMGMKAAAKKAYGSDDLNGKRVVVQGAGNVGRYLIDYLVKEGASVKVADIFESQLKLVTDKHAAVEVIAADAVFNQDMDIYAPCALGATVNDESLSKLTAKVIAGAANNQLADERKHGEAVLAKSIVYAPDYVINAGGLINCYSELEGYNRDRAMAGAEEIYRTTLDIFAISDAENIPTYLAANRKAERRIEAIANVHRGY